MNFEMQYPMAAIARIKFSTTKKPLLDECSTCTLHGLPCMGCAEALKGEFGPGKISNQRTLYKFEDNDEAYVHNYADPSLDGTGYVDSEFIKNSKKWLKNNPEETVVFIKV